jgi:Fatty acid desaturase
MKLQFFMASLAQLSINLGLRLSQAMLTFIRGVALEGEKPLFNLGPWGWICGALLELALSIVGSHWVLAQNDPNLYSLLMLTFASGQAFSWTTSMAMCHHGAHGAISRLPWVNRLVAEVGSTINLTQGFDAYRKSHNGKHHPPKKLATPEDPDYLFMLRFGFKPGQTVDYYWNQLFKTLVNLEYYWYLLVRRFRANFITAPAYRIAMAVAWWSFVLGLTVYASAYLTLVIGYLLPLVFGHGISVLLQTITEHDWGQSEPARKTFARLLDVMQPQSANPLIWAAYLLKIMAYLYWRLAIIPTDLPQHQIHHYLPHNFQWFLAAYSSEAQQRDLPHAVWSIRGHFKKVFQSLAEAPSID